MSQTNQLLREYVREVLHERTRGGGPELGDYGDELGDIFFKPFKDAAKVIKGEIAKLSARAQSAVATLARGMTALVLPFFDARFDEIKRREQDRIREIESDPEYQEAWKIVKPHATTGLSKLFFMFDPVGYIATDLVTRNPTATLGVLGAMLVGPKKALLAAAAKKSYDAARLRNPKSKQTRDWKQLVASINALKESRIISERVNLDPETVQKFLASDEVQRILANSDLVRRMQEKATELAQETASEMLEPIKEILDANSFEEIEKILGKNIDTSSMTNVSGEEASIQAASLEQVKQELKKSAIEKIGNHIEEIGLRDNKEHPYHKILLKAVESLTR